MIKELDKLLEFWAEFHFLNESEWKVFKHQFSLILSGCTWETVKHLSKDFDV